ncbi:hypothetical protein HPP92_020954 [Vanilla planifolia]|uniref:Uncharacterized protein n=1 Tax=Vanilla planifolia TaxID=51239 RepID=A0A835Q0M9_VANPL|nr:hypothetical protein HPP92_020954 [Vanilla planifolia]
MKKKDHSLLLKLVAAFLAKLVDQDVVGTSARCSLKAASVESPGIRLACRHCFILEDPPVDTRDPLVSESVTGIGNVDGLKEDHLHSLSGSSELNNEVEDSLANAASSQSAMKQSATYHEGSQKSSPEKESSVSFHLLDSRDDTRSDDKWEDRTSQSDTKDAYDVKDPVLSTTDNSYVVIASPRQSGSMPNVVNIVDTVDVTEKNIQNCVDQSYNKESLDQEQHSESTKAVDTMPSPVIMTDELQNNDVAWTKCTSEILEGDNEMASLPKNDSNLLSAPENHAMNSIKRAAVSFLSAAAVKAKLLVNQEEEKSDS